MTLDEVSAATGLTKSYLSKVERGQSVWVMIKLTLLALPQLLAVILPIGLFVGALIALVPTVLYRAQTQYALEWGMTPLEDQQAAGLIMWAPAAALYLFAALWRLGRMIGPDAEAHPA